MKKIHSITIAERLKLLRESKGLTPQQLSNAINEKYKHEISPDTIKAYEQRNPEKKRANKNLGMRAENLFYLAAFFGVTADYILGLSEISNTNPDIMLVCETTGLSEESASFLYETNQVAHNDSLTSEKKEELLAHISLLAGLPNQLLFSKDEVARVSYQVSILVDIILDAYRHSINLQDYVDILFSTTKYVTDANDQLFYQRSGLNGYVIHELVCSKIGELIGKHLESLGPDITPESAKWESHNA